MLVLQLLKEVPMKSWIQRHTGKLSIGVASALVATLVAIVGVNVLTERAAGSTSAVIDQATFPALEAVYVETGTQDGKAIARTWKLTYTDASHWRKELVDMSLRQSGKFDQVGYFEEASGNTVTVGSPITPKITRTNDRPSVPFRWFVPGRLSYLKNAGKAVQVTQVSVSEMSVTLGDETYRLESRYGVPLEVNIDNTHFVSQSLTFK